MFGVDGTMCAANVQHADKKAQTDNTFSNSSRTLIDAADAVANVPGRSSLRPGLLMHGLCQSGAVCRTTMQGV
jgi:hypothetical protein